MSEGLQVGGIEKSAATSSPSFLGGAMIIAGTAVGAGMFSVPTVSAGMWSIWLFLRWPLPGSVCCIPV